MQTFFIAYIGVGVIIGSAVSAFMVSQMDDVQSFGESFSLVIPITALFVGAWPLLVGMFLWYFPWEKLRGN